MRYYEVLLQELLADQALKPSDRAIYLHIYERQPDSLRELARVSGLSRSAVRRACGRLAEARWIRLEQAKKREDGFQLIPLVPAGCQDRQLKYLQVESDMAVSRGELLMKRQLDLRVRDRAFVDNARPVELEQPNGRRLELDRLYVNASVGFEFCGLYHHSPREGASAEEIESILATQTRDLVKAGLSVKTGLNLVRVNGEDLRFEAFAKLIPKSLPLRRLNPDCLYYRELARMCEGYAKYVAKIGRDAGGAKGR